MWCGLGFATDCWHSPRVDLISSLPAFVLAVVFISASPGPAMALILRRAALRGFRGAVPTVLGLEVGLYAWALMAAAGVAALVAASEVAFLILRIFGALTLIFLGLRAWRAAWLARRDLSAIGASTSANTSAAVGWKAFGEGLIVQLANPKAAVFMIAFYPQFVPADQPLFATTATLALLRVVVETVLYLALAASVSRASKWFRRPTVRQRLDAASGAVLIGMGIRVAATSR